MRIKKLKIKNYRAFGKNSDIIDFEVPNGKSPGSGLTIFVGPNNSGKSTALDALLKFDEQKRILEEDKRTKGPFGVKVIDNEDKIKEVSTKRESSQIVISGDSSWDKDSIEFIPSRRPWNHRFSGSSNIDSYRQQKYLEERKQPIDSRLASLLDFMHRNKKEDFSELMREVVPKFSEWNIKTDRQGDYISYSFANAQVEHGIDLLGDGTINLFAIVAYLLEQDKNKTLIIDEPELSLHPEAQRRLFALLKKLSKEKQIVVSTHSPYFVDAEVVMSVRKFKLDSSGPEIKIYKAKNFLSTKEPAVFSFWHRDLFFAEKSIFIEGPEDYVRLKNYILMLEQKEAIGNIHYLFPVYGKGNENFFREFCKSFGIKYFFIFDVDYIESNINRFLNIDSDKKSKKHGKQWYRKNFSKFEAEYKKEKTKLKKKNVFIWSKPDIADILDKNGKPKSGMEAETKECIDFICGKNN